MGVKETPRGVVRIAFSVTVFVVHAVIPGLRTNKEMARREHSQAANL